MVRNVRLCAAVQARPAGAGGEVGRSREIQLHRRQQRRRSGAGRRADRGLDRGAATRGPHARDLRACARPARLPAAARIPHAEAQARRRHRLHRRRHPRHVGLVAGDRSRQRRLPRARRHRDHRAGMLPGLDQPADAGSASTPSASRSTATACAWTRCRTRSTTSSAAACARNTSTPSRPCRTRPAPSCRRRAAPNC